MYAFTVGFKAGETTPTLLYGPDTPVEKQDADLDRAARIDDGGDYATVEIVYSNGRPKRRVDFTTPEQKAAINARAAAALAKKEAAALEQNEARIMALRVELAELEAAALFAAESDPDTGNDDGKEPTDTPPAPDVPYSDPHPMTAGEILAAAVFEKDADMIAAEAAAIKGKPVVEDIAAPAPPADIAPSGGVSGKRGRAA